MMKKTMKKMVQGIVPQPLVELLLKQVKIILTLMLMMLMPMLMFQLIMMMIMLKMSTADEAYD